MRRQIYIYIYLSLKHAWLELINSNLPEFRRSPGSELHGKGQVSQRQMIWSCSRQDLERGRRFDKKTIESVDETTKGPYFALLNGCISFVDFQAILRQNQEENRCSLWIIRDQRQNEACVDILYGHEYYLTLRIVKKYHLSAYLTALQTLKVNLICLVLDLGHFVGCCSTNIFPGKTMTKKKEEDDQCQKLLMHLVCTGLQARTHVLISDDPTLLGRLGLRQYLANPAWNNSKTVYFAASEPRGPFQQHLNSYLSSNLHKTCVLCPHISVVEGILETWTCP